MELAPRKTGAKKRVDSLLIVNRKIHLMAGGADIEL
jgi:hypothetical protein